MVVKTSQTETETDRWRENIIMPRSDRQIHKN